MAKNHQTAGKIPNGGIIEKEVPLQLAGKSELFLSLRSPDFTTARNMSDAINRNFSANVAEAVDAGSIRLQVPAPEFSNGVDSLFLAKGSSIYFFRATSLFAISLSSL